MLDTDIHIGPFSLKLHQSKQSEIIIFFKSGLVIPSIFAAVASE